MVVALEHSIRVLFFCNSSKTCSIIWYPYVSNVMRHYWNSSCHIITVPWLLDYNNNTIIIWSNSGTKFSISSIICTINIPSLSFRNIRLFLSNVTSVRFDNSFRFVVDISTGWSHRLCIRPRLWYLWFQFLESHICISSFSKFHSFSFISICVQRSITIRTDEKKLKGLGWKCSQQDLRGLICRRKN